MRRRVPQRVVIIVQRRLDEPFGGGWMDQWSAENKRSYCLTFSTSPQTCEQTRKPSCRLQLSRTMALSSRGDTRRPECENIETINQISQGHFTSFTASSIRTRVTFLPELRLYFQWDFKNLDGTIENNLSGGTWSTATRVMLTLATEPMSSTVALSFGNWENIFSILEMRPSMLRLARGRPCGK